MFNKSLTTSFLFICTILLHTGVLALDNQSELSAPIQAQILSVNHDQNVKHYTIKISNDASAKLSQVIIGLPCGKLSNIKISENWPYHLEVLDKETGIYGFKFLNSAKTQQSKEILLDFDILALGDYCESIMETWRPKIAYKYGNQIITDTLETKSRDIPDDILFDKLHVDTQSDEFEVKAYNDEQTAEAVFDVISNESDQIKLEIYTTTGKKISTMFIGAVKKGIRNLITFSYNAFPENKYIYKLTSSYTELYGKLIFP